MLTTLQIKLIAYVVLAAGIGSGVLYIKHVFNKAEQQEAEIKELKLSRDTAVASLGLYQENNERQVKIISEYQVKLDEKDKITSNLERDVANNKRKLYVKASCEPSSSAAADTSTTSTASATLDASARPAYYALRRGIDQLESNYALCLQILNEDRRQKNAPKSGG